MCGDRHGGVRAQGKGRVYRRTSGGQGVGAAAEVQLVVRLACVEAGASGRDQSAGAELAQVVGDQVLRCPQGDHQLSDPPVRAGELADQPPPQRLGQQPHGRWDDWHVAHPYHQLKLIRPRGDTSVAAWRRAGVAAAWPRLEFVPHTRQSDDTWGQERVPLCG